MFKQLPNGEYYFFPTGSLGTEIIVRDEKTKGKVITLNAPKELIGKKVRIKLEIVTEE